MVIHLLPGKESLCDHDVQSSFIRFFLVFLKFVKSTHKKTFVVAGSWSTYFAILSSIFEEVGTTTVFAQSRNSCQITWTLCLILFFEIRRQFSISFCRLANEESLISLSNDKRTIIFLNASDFSVPHNLFKEIWREKIIFFQILLVRIRSTHWLSCLTFAQTWKHQNVNQSIFFFSI
jgi:hypothetical protein